MLFIIIFFLYYFTIFITAYSILRCKQPLRRAGMEYDRDCEGLKWIGISLSEEKMTCMYQRFFMQAAKKALRHHACKGVFKVEIDNYSNSLTMTNVFMRCKWERPLLL